VEDPALKSFARILVPFAVVGSILVATPPARAQTGSTAPTDTLSLTSRSSWEAGYLSIFDFDRVPVGARMSAMGGAGLAVAGGPEYMSLNPAALIGVERPQLESSAVFYSGGTTVQTFPELLDIGRAQFLQSKDYRVSPSTKLNYNNVSLGIPLVILGGRGGLGLSYRREARTGEGAESRAVLQGPFAAGQEVNYGRGDTPEDGLDVISVGAARAFGTFLDLGISLNWQSGTLHRSESYGLSQFGFEFLNGGYNFSQDASGFNVDLGGRMHLGRLLLAGTAHMAHDLDFKNGTAIVRPVPNDLTETKYLAYTNLVDNTLSIPTAVGLGASLDLSDRLTLVGDYWIRPWSKVDVTRQEIVPTVGFSNPEDSTSYFVSLATTDNQETFNARLNDANSLRLGMEYIMHRTDRVQVPVRFGYRTEKLALSNTTIPGTYADYPGMISRYYDGSTAAEDSLLQAAEFSNLLFRGSPVKSTTFTFGLGVDIDSFSAALSVERRSYDIDNFYLYGFNPDPRFNATFPSITAESRHILTIGITSRMRF
jgi:hypothetical protein